MKRPYYLLLILCSVFTLLTYAQNRTYIGKIGEVKELYKKRASSNAKISSGNKILHSLVGKQSLALKVTSNKQERDGEYFYGEVDNTASGKFFLKISGQEASGQVVMLKEKKFYRYLSTSDGSIYLTEEDIDKVLCVNYEQKDISADTSFDSNSAAVAAAPPILESLPGATAVLYLDFDGHTVTNTLWNRVYTGGSPIVAEPSTIPENEMIEIWKLISEDFRPFTLNVTTNEAVFKNAPISQRMQIIFTPTKSWFPNAAGGVAYIGSFPWGGTSNGEAPCWAWNTGIKGAGDVGSHEAGHTLGLVHDGRTSPLEEYFWGQNQWGPIMGASYSVLAAQWSKGEYPNANNMEDDLEKISTLNGFGYRNDDHGNDISTATPLIIEANGDISAAKNKGVITTRTDVDVFSFTTTGGFVALSVNTDPTYPNLDVLLTLRNSLGVVIETADPPTVDASIKSILQPGTYYLTVDGAVGALGANSDYASIGAYSISTSTYCIPFYEANCSTINQVFINSISFNTLINNNSGCGSGTANRYTYYAPVGQLTTSVNAGGTYHLTLQSDFGQNFGVWIDYNQDKDFEDAGEFVFATSATTTSVTTNITIPTSASLGQTRIRIRSTEHVPFDQTRSCTRSAYGEAEDYTITITPPTNGTLIAKNSTWKYNDKGVNLGTSWTGIDYNDGTWQSGAGVLGYGDPVTTTLSYGPNSSSKYPSYYFRKRFEVANASAYTGLVFGIRRDDGAVVYLNGVELFRTNMPNGTIGYNTLASVAQGGADETTYFSIKLPATQLRNGKNVLAVSVHQENVTSSDMSFDLELKGEVSTTTNQPPAVSLTAPVNGSTFTAPASINLFASASDGDGTIAKVEFYQGTTKLGEDVTAPYGYIWSGVAAGTYSLTARAIDDVGSVTASTAVSVTVNAVSTTCPGTGSITREYWANIPGVSISNIPLLNTAPTSTSQLTSFETETNLADQYGQRIRGYICAPVTGAYTFYLSGDDDCELYLSTNDNPGNKQKIAFIYNGWTNPKEWTKYPSQKSATINLQAGTKYYVEALHKEGWAGDNFAVGWITPGSSAVEVIAGSSLAPFVPTGNQQPTVSITSPTSGSSFTAPATINITATAFDPDGSIAKVEFYWGETKLGEDLTAPYEYTWSNVGAGSYTINAKAIDNLGAVTTSTAVSTTVSQVSTTCPRTGSITREYWANVDGTSVSNIPLNTTPTSITLITSFETSTDAADLYGQRIRGYICPPESGSYTFYLSGDDDCELWLSNTDNPAGKQRIAFITNGWTYPKEWMKYASQKSTVITLQAGTKYYIEALHKEGWAGDNLAVGWITPQNNSITVIPGTALSPLTSTPPVNGDLITKNSVWKYNDKGIDLGTSWRATEFDDASWSSGAGALGYDDPVTTTISYGINASLKHPSYYFRKSFDITNVSAYSALVFNIRRDDGAVVYLNGVEVFRTNMPGGTVGYNTLASSSLGGSDETTYFTYRVSTTQLRNGKNVVAVSVHQGSRSSSDLDFDLELKAETSSSQLAAARINSNSTGSTNKEEVAIENNSSSTLSVKALPNPSTTQFTLVLQSSSLEPVDLKVVDANGRIVEVRRKLGSNGSFVLGTSYRPGVYFLEAVQGKERRTLKLVKGVE